MLLTESTQPFKSGGTSNRTELTSVPSSIQSSTNRRYARSMSSLPSASASAPLRLADIAKQHGMGVHVENWREDMFPVRQYLPMQHIIGSLKRDRDEQVRYLKCDDPTAWRTNLARRQSDIAATSPHSEDSFLHGLRTPKRRRISDCSRTDSQCTAESDPDRRFSYQSAEHVSKDIPQSALPGLNHILNLATITAAERDIFSEYAPKHLDDPQLLMMEVLQLRSTMMGDKITADDAEGVLDSTELGGMISSVVPPERDAEVRKAFESFIDLNGGDKRYIAKI